MSNKYIYILFAVSFLLFGCSEYGSENKIPDDIPRLDELSSNYTEILASQEYGWKVMYQPDPQYGGFTVLMNFNTDGTVTIRSDLPGFFDPQENVRFSVSGINYPELRFETFCVWHQIYEIADGEFEFRINEVNNQSIILSSINYQYLPLTYTMIPASHDDYRIMEQNKKTAGLLDTLVNHYDGYFKILELSGNIQLQALISFLLDNNQLSITWVTEQDSIASQTINYFYSENGISFMQSLEAGGSIIEYLRIDGLDNNGNVLISEAGEGNSGILTSNNTPGFTLSGANDRFKSYRYFIYDLNYSSRNNPFIDSLLSPAEDIGDLLGIIIYQNLDLPSGYKNQLSIVYNSDSIGFEYYDFQILDFKTVGEDKLRLTWNGEYSQNITEDIFDKFEDFIMFMFDKDGFIVVPEGLYMTLVSRENSKNYVVFDAIR